ncbi:MAG: glycosyltransferase family 4 protein [Candidatus Helarchaeota archaeon]
MKIALIVHSYIPFISGGELIVKQTAEYLAKKNDIIVITRKIKNKKDFELIKKVQVYRTSPSISRMTQITDNKYFFQSFLFSLFSVFKIISLYKKKKFRLIHAHQFNSGLPSLIINKLFKIPYIFTLQKGLGADDYLSIYKTTTNFSFIFDWASPILKLILKNAVKIHTASNASANAIMRMGIKRDKIVIIPNSTNTNLFCPLNVERKDRIITVSRLTQKNGIEYLIKAMPKVLEDFSDVELDIIGYGPEEEKLKSLVRELNIEKNVKFLGFINHEEIPQHLCSAKLFIRPSLEEGFGTAFIEAMACETLVIGTKVGGITDIIKDKKNGFLFPPKDVKKLSNIIIRVLKDEDLRRKISTKGLETVLKKFSEEVILLKMENLYLETYKSHV